MVQAIDATIAASKNGLIFWVISSCPVTTKLTPPMNRRIKGILAAYDLGACGTYSILLLAPDSIPSSASI
jgi:hypothetical protein